MASKSKKITKQKARKIVRGTVVPPLTAPPPALYQTTMVPGRERALPLPGQWTGEERAKIIRRDVIYPVWAQRVEIASRVNAGDARPEDHSDLAEAKNIMALAYLHIEYWVRIAHWDISVGTPFWLRSVGSGQGWPPPLDSIELHLQYLETEGYAQRINIMDGAWSEMIRAAYKKAGMDKQRLTEEIPTFPGWEAFTIWTFVKPIPTGIYWPFPDDAVITPLK